MSVRVYEITGIAPKAKKQSPAETEFIGTKEQMLLKVKELRQQGWSNLRHCDITKRLHRLNQDEGKTPSHDETVTQRRLKLTAAVS